MKLNMLNTQSIGRSKEFKKHVFLRYEFRYEKYWIPFIAANSPELRFDTNFSPPVDVLWVWHVHMLAPQHYATDLQNSMLGGSNENLVINICIGNQSYV